MLVVCYFEILGLVQAQGKTLTRIAKTMHKPRGILEAVGMEIVSKDIAEVQKSQLIPFVIQTMANRKNYNPFKIAICLLKSLYARRERG